MSEKSARVQRLINSHNHSFTQITFVTFVVNAQLKKYIRSATGNQNDIICLCLNQSPRSIVGVVLQPVALTHYRASYVRTAQALC